MTSRSRPWEAECPVEPELARALVAAAAPELAQASIEAFGSGWDNTAYLVDGRWVFRFPRREMAVAAMQTEIRALPVLSRRLPLRIPEPVHVGSPSGDYPRPHAGYACLPGELVALRPMPVDEACAEQLGGFLARLHGQRSDELTELGIPGDLLRRLDPEHRIPLAHRVLDALEAADAVTDARPLRELIDDTLPEPGSQRPRVLVHGDFDARHLLADSSGVLLGVIDWGDLHFGDPALDLAIAHTLVPPQLRSAFRAAYGPISEQTWSAARFRALHNTLHVLDWAVDTRAAALEASARGWLENLLREG